MKHALIAGAFALTLLTAGAPLIASAQFDTCAHYNDDGTCADQYGNTVTDATTQVKTGNATPGSGIPGGINVAYLMGYSSSVQNVINFILVPVLVAIAFLVFVWGAYKYFILGAADAAERATGRQFVLWSVIGFVAIFSLWGLVAMVGSTLGLNAGGGAPPTPKI